MNIKRAFFMAVLVVAIAALAVPLVGLRAAASGSGAASSSAAAKAKARAASATSAGAQQAEQQKEVGSELQVDSAQAGKISPETLKALGLTKSANPKEATARIAEKLRNKHKNSAGGDVSIQSGQPLNLNARSALSDALIIAIGGRDNQFSEVALIADWDGREDCIADREQKLDDTSEIELEPDGEATRTAISEHTVANGFNENVYYWGDSLGNLWILTDTNPGQPGALAGTPAGLNPPGVGAQQDVLGRVNIPALVNDVGVAQGGFLFPFITSAPGVTPVTVNPAGIVNGGLGYLGCMDDQVVVTGIAVNPVADLCDFGLTGVNGEIVYVSVVDTEGCAAAVLGAGNIVIRTSIFEFAFRDDPAATLPGTGSSGVLPVAVRRIFVSTQVDFAGVAVDDDGSLYFQLVDLIQFTGGAIMKLAETPHTTCGGTACISRVLPTVAGGGTAYNVNIIPTSINVWQVAAIPAISGIRATNYSGPSTLFGDVISIATGPCNTLYAAVSASFVAGAQSFDQRAQGLFPAPTQFGANGTPSMVISFADCSGAFDICSGRAAGSIITNVGGTLPVADGFADVANAAVTTRIPGVNNFRLFVEGGEAGKDLLPATGGTAVVPGTPSTQPWLRIPGFQVDYVPAHAGLAVSQEGTVFVISGGATAGPGKDPSSMFSEVLCFEDSCPADRRADFVDLRSPFSSTVPINNPNPGQGAGNTGDGVSDRFDHIFYQAPIDVNSATPAGLAGLNLGFLRYTNRLAPNGIQGGPTGAAVLDTHSGLALGQVGGTTILSDDSTTSAAILFEGFDPGHQVAGGDDQNGPNTGDDSDTVTAPASTLSVAGNPFIPAITPWGSESTIGLAARGLNGGFEFVFKGGPTSSATCVWNGLFLNSNGNLTFAVGDTSHNPTVPIFRNGPTKIAAAWADLNPASRVGVAGVGGNCGTFPVMALGFVNVNAFKTRWINVPEFGAEACTALGVAGASNTFSITLYDDGTGADENTTETAGPAANVGNNINDGAVSFDQLEGPTDLRTTRVNFSNPVGGSRLVSCSPRPEGSGIIVFDYCRMDLLGTPERPVITGYSIGGLNPLNNPPATLAGLCEVNLSVAAAAADAGAFGLLTGNQIAAIGCSCCIGEGTEPTIFELFNEGRDAGTGTAGEVTFARPDFDLRFEGNDAQLCTSIRQRDLNRGRICFLGVGCSAPSPICREVVPGTVVLTPTTTGLVNALCAVPLNIVGCGFFPNEITIICQGFAEDTGIPLQRPGKTVTTSATLQCDTNGDLLPDSQVIVLGNVTPVNCNLITATILPLASRTGTGFPDACCGGTGFITVTTTFTAGDNNVFGAFVRTVLCTVPLGVRAPVVFSVTPSGGDCSLPIQDLLVSGACFCGPDGSFNITSAIFQDVSNPANTITIGLNPGTRGQIKPLTCNLFDVEVNFTSANAGKTFLFFAVGPGGTSRNLGTLPAGSPVGCPIGNEQGTQVTFKCNNPGVPQPCTPGTPGCNTPQIATVTNCHLDRQENGTFFLDVTGKDIKAGAVVTVGGFAPKKTKVVEVDPGTNNPTKLRLVKRICNGLPGEIVITNPGAAASVPLLCTERCPAN